MIRAVLSRLFKQKQPSMNMHSALLMALTFPDSSFHVTPLHCFFILPNLIVNKSPLRVYILKLNLLFWH